MEKCMQKHRGDIRKNLFNNRPKTHNQTSSNNIINNHQNTWSNIVKKHGQQSSLLDKDVGHHHLCLTALGLHPNPWDLNTKLMNFLGPKLVELQKHQALHFGLVMRCRALTKIQCKSAHVERLVHHRSRSNNIETYQIPHVIIRRTRNKMRTCSYR
jgi:hypothetical protein